MDTTVFIVALTIFSAVSCQLDPPIVKVAEGQVIGSLLTSQRGARIYAFRGIPYAQPPVGKLRFKLPQTVLPWKDVLNATVDGPMCVQWDLFNQQYDGQEDCLVLNVYTPRLPSTGEMEEKLAVMVSIHGGGFIMGSGNSVYYSPTKFLDRQIVLVTFNYRLGALGLLSTGDDVSPGNYGLFDQIEVLKWVQRNIAQFGGDPGKVTIFGESAGGGSASHLLISDKAKGLFHGAILQSGASLCEWGVGEDGKMWSKKLAIKLGCRAHTSQEIVDCLLTKEAVDIIKAQNDIMLEPYLTMTFRPVVERTQEGLFPEHPLHLLEKNQINRVPTIVGVTQDEGLVSYAAISKNLNQLQDEYFTEDLPFVLQDYLGLQDNYVKAAQIAVKHYFKNVDKTDENQIREALTKLYSDSLFNVGAARVVEHLTKHDLPTFTYKFNHRGKFSYLHFFNITEYSGVCHADDVQYFFDNIFGTPLEGDDAKVSELLIDLWTNFAMFQNPTPNKDLSFEWLPSEYNKPRYLEISTNPRMIEKELSDNVQFWKTYLSKNVISNLKDEL